MATTSDISLLAQSSQPTRYGLEDFRFRLAIPLIALVCASGVLTAAEPASAAKPNIIVIFADDLGYADVGVQGGKEIPTPNIDSIAKNGVRFGSGYVSCPYCSPTRAGFLTGRYQQRFGHEFNPGGGGGNAAAGNEPGLPLSETTLANRLKPAGYTTALVGKWHQGSVEKFHPLRRGFDEFFGFLGGAHSFTNLATTGNDPIRRGFEPVEEKEYLTDAFTREAVSFIDRHQKKPFFLYLAYNAVHTPLDTHPKYYDRFPQIQDEKRRRFAALYAALDDGVGAVLKKLKDSGLEENTLVVFLSDNGGPTAANTSRNDPLRGFKTQTWEGGVRVPFFVQWKGKLPAGTVYEQPVIQLDIHATALAAAGVAVKPEWKLDGVNLLPHLTGENKKAPHDVLYWRFGEQIAVRKGDWKLVKGAGAGVAQGGNGKATTEGAQLYNLAKDIGEQTNLAASEPAKVKELSEDWNRWNAELIDPLWRPGNAPGAGGGQGNANVGATAPEQGPWKSGDELERADSPRIANRALALSARIDLTGTEGVIVAQGATRQGYALYVHEGKLAFAARVDGELTVVKSKEALPKGSSQVAAELAADGGVKLLVNGKTTAEGKIPKLVSSQPGGGLTVGSDGEGAVGDYADPNPFAGKVEDVRFRFL